MLRIGVIGYGYWGPNLVRNFNSLERAEVINICDPDSTALARARRAHPTIEAVSKPDELLRSTHIDVVAIATPVSSHFELAKAALKNDKHVFIEKPMTSTEAQAEYLIELAASKRLTIMVDHTFIFTSAVRKIKELIDRQILGNLYYYDSMRINLGLFQHDVNVIWDLAPHDLAIMDFLIRHKPVALTANGMAHFANGLQNVAYITVYFTDNLIAHFNVNWLSPVKVRTTLIGGEKKMLVWNDLQADEKIKIYDKGVELKNGDGIYKTLVNYRTGDMWAPQLDQTEALKIEAEHFVDCITNSEKPLNDGHAGLRVVRMLKACSESLDRKGDLVYL